MLPEVETFRTKIAAALEGRRLEKLTLDQERPSAGAPNW